jgi:hypothetical protein
VAAFFKARFALIFASALLVVMERCADAQLGKICLIVERLSLLSSGMAQWQHIPIPPFQEILHFLLLVNIF